MAACQTDLATFCPGIEAGGGRKMKCLAENRAKLSPECGVTVDLRLARKAAKGAMEETENLSTALMENLDGVRLIKIENREAAE
ncbi:MAG TPA: hypothetical protein PK264_19460, partial [Hyphomicrobiaceae bacterium]|nr:hypothetical protein [Hyphomicrobiaceae bacterium]